MPYFSYISLVSLFDTASIDAFSKYVAGKDGGSFDLIWLYKMLAMLVIAAICFIVGNEIFKKKTSLFKGKPSH